MVKEVENLYAIIKNYRKDEGNEFGISCQRITSWINQFPEKDRIFILTELTHIFRKVYFSKKRTKKFLKRIVENLRQKFSYPTHKKFLNNANFLDLQAEGKSQKVLLELLFEVLQNDFNYNSKNLGRESKKHNVYIDDVLCTGNTFFNNLKNWVTEEGENRLVKLRSGEIDLSVFYMFIAKKYYSKKIGQFYYQISRGFSDLITVRSLYRFEKEILQPLDEALPNLIIEYKEKVENNVDNHAQNKGFKSYSPNFFRSAVNPEEFYSSIENRKRLELIFLKKGVEILNNSNASKTNVRPLGYSLPSYKDFGFGAMIFTWRNVANNTPLVFWYRGRGFIPLFVNKR